MNQEFDELVKEKLAEKQLITNDSNKENNPPDMTDESAKRPDFFQSNKQSQKNQRENTQLHASNQEISSPIFLILE